MYRIFWASGADAGASGSDASERMLLLPLLLLLLLLLRAARVSWLWTAFSCRGSLAPHQPHG